jgi:protein phosphatase PTC7
MLLGHHEPIKVSAAGLAIPLPEKIINRLSKGVNKRGFGHGGEDAYFFCEGR